MGLEQRVIEVTHDAKPRNLSDIVRLQVRLKATEGWPFGTPPPRPLSLFKVCLC